MTDRKESPRWAMATPKARLLREYAARDTAITYAASDVEGTLAHWRAQNTVELEMRRAYRHVWALAFCIALVVAAALIAWRLWAVS